MNKEQQELAVLMEKHCNSIPSGKCIDSCTKCYACAIISAGYSKSQKPEPKEQLWICQSAKSCTRYEIYHCKPHIRRHDCGAGGFCQECVPYEPIPEEPYIPCENKCKSCANFSHSPIDFKRYDIADILSILFKKKGVVL
jgi:hypothetical protein